MLREIFAAIRGKQPVASRPSQFRPKLPVADDDGMAAGPPDDGELPLVSGYSCIIEYRDTKGQVSERQISCVRIERAPKGVYLRAHCHERRQMRLFKVASIVTVSDCKTGEVLGDGPELFSGFRADVHSAAGVTWGLSPTARGELLAGLVVMMFLARCDKDWHPAEAEVVEEFVTGWWIRKEIRHEPPLNEIADYCDRLGPDSEAFVLAVHKCANDAVLSKLTAGYCGRLIEADGRIASEEAHWIAVVRKYLAG